MAVVLTSDFPSTPTPEVVDRIRACGRSARIAWIAPRGSSRIVHFPLARLRFGAVGVRGLEFVDASRPRPEQRDLLQRFDVLYLSGGDPLVFRSGLARSGLDEQIRAFAAEGRLVVAASGGALQLTPNVSIYRLLHATLDDVLTHRAQLGGLGLANVELLPHANRHPPAFLSLVVQYSQRIPHDILALDDGAAVIQERADTCRCVGRVMRYRDGVSTPIGNGASDVRTTAR